jgi:polyferredoxin
VSGASRNDEERRRIFRRMEWAFVWAPPLIALVFGLSGSAVLAFLVPIPGVGFYARWAIFVVLVLVVPTLGYLVWERVRR